ncbi:MAG: hypothetical protein ACRDQZ_06815 [Mycobacteriales bacterium]
MAVALAGCGSSDSYKTGGMGLATTSLTGNWVTYFREFGMHEALGAFVIKADKTYSHFTYLNGKPDPASRFTGPITPVAGHPGTYIFEDKDSILPGTKYTAKLRGGTLSLEISSNYIEDYEKVSKLP